MDNPKNGTTQPAQGELSQLEPNKAYRTYKKPNGDSFQITEEQFQAVVAIFDFLRASRDEKDSQAELLEPNNLSTQTTGSPVKLKKVG